jgi:hypothetical protein
MDAKEATEKLNNIPDGDPEGARLMANDILLDFLTDNGFSEVAGAWVDVEDRAEGFWYA